MREVPLSLQVSFYLQVGKLLSSESLQNTDYTVLQLKRGTGGAEIFQARKFLCDTIIIILRVFKIPAHYPLISGLATDR